jgi:D-3-phosphoglycerate dehydrogenase
LIRNAAIQGILNESLEEKADLVNAASMASARGLRVHEERRPQVTSGGAASVLGITVKARGGEEHSAKGAVLHGHAPRLLHLNGIDIEAPLAQNLVYLRNRDVPGVIGQVGTILGNHQINIADFSLGRRAGEPNVGVREAIAVVHVDEVVPATVLAELRTISAIQQARVMRLY